MEQNSTEWLEVRKSKIGASDAPIILGVSPWKTPYQLWCEKVGLQEPPNMNRAMMRGHDLEPIARDLYEKITGKMVMPQVLFHPDHKWMMASLDGLSLEQDVILEIKCPGEKDHAIALSGKVPEKYYPQLQHQLAVLGKGVVHYFSFREDSYALVEIFPDKEYQRKLIEEEIKFWRGVNGLEPPALCDKDYVRRDDLSWKALADQYKQARFRLQEAENEEKRCREELICAADGRSIIGCDIKLSCYTKKGSIDYTSIPELKEKDLSLYRKAPTTCWRVTTYDHTTDS